MSWFKRPKPEPQPDPRKRVETFEDLAAYLHDAKEHLFSREWREPEITSALLLIVERIEAIEAKGAK